MGLKFVSASKDVIGDPATCLEGIEPKIRQRKFSFFGHVTSMQPEGLQSPPMILSESQWEFAVVVLVIPTCSSPVNAAWPRTSWAEQLGKDTSGIEHWDAFYLAFERDRWSELSTSICSLGIKGSSDIYRQVHATFNIVHELGTAVAIRRNRSSFSKQYGLLNIDSMCSTTLNNFIQQYISKSILSTWYNICMLWTERWLSNVHNWKPAGK